MPRTYKPKNVIRYTEDELKAAINKVRVEKKAIYGVAKEFNIPRATLRRWIVSTPSHQGRGRNTVLSLDEEKLIVDAVKFVSNCGFPQSRTDIRNMVQSFIQDIKRETPFPNSRPGLEWMRNFEKRHANEIKRGRPEHLSVARSESLNRSTIDSFFNMYEKMLKDNIYYNGNDRI